MQKTFQTDDVEDTKTRESDGTIDIISSNDSSKNGLRNGVDVFEAPVVFKIYSKHMKEDIEFLIIESVRRNEEERNKFLTQLNSNSSANFRRRRHKRMSANASKILSRRFGGMLHYYKQLR